MAAEIEEAVVGRDLGHVEHLAEDGRQPRLHRAARLDVAPRLRREIGRRERAVIDLAARRERDRVEAHDHRGHHRLRQRVAEVGLEIAHREIPGDDVGDEALLAAILAGDHHRGADAGVLREHGLDLAELDAEAADLHLMIDAAEVLERAARQEAREIPGAVEPLARREGIGDELLGRELGAVEVPAGEPDAADAELPGTPIGTRLRAESRITIRVLAMGLPMLGLPPPAKHSPRLAQIDVSVGPYASMKRRPGAQRDTSSSEHASPATMIVWRSGRLTCGRAARTEGEMVSAVIRCSTSVFTSSGPGKSASASASTSVPPLSKAITISQTEASKLNEASWRTREPGPGAKDPCMDFGHVDEAVMLDHHPFGAAGRSRGVDHVSEAVRIGERR